MINNYTWLLTLLKLKIMNKKDLKWYETPTTEVVEVEFAASLLQGSTVPDTDDSGDNW